MSDRATVAVVGAGFSGVLTAVRLLLEPDGPNVRLIERAERFGRGAAYATGNPSHLLNVRATNMSAFVEQPEHFLEWLRQAGEAADSPGGEVFVTRDRYGQYLQSILRRGAANGGAGRLLLEHDEVVAATPNESGWRLRLAVGRDLLADAVVLALGNLPPQPPPGLSPEVAASPHYAADPWAWDPARLPPGERVLLLGSGLTAVDLALTIAEARPMARILALSRHGLLPRRHGPASAIENPGDLGPLGSPTEALRAVRAAARDDWRAAIDSLRPRVQPLWRSWSLTERRRFLRHLRPWWDVHRHRLAPTLADQLDGLEGGGRFRCEPGRIRSLAPGRDGVEVAWTPRGGAARLDRFDMIVNCVGPREDLTHCNDPLIVQLRQAGLVRPDALGLGLDVDSRSRVIAAHGEAQETLFAVGPITRGQFYEITSAPDIRIQAADCATTVVNSLAARLRAASAGGGDGRLASDLGAYLREAIAELDVELGALKFSRRVRNAWELRGRRAGLDEISLWLEARDKGD